MTLRHLLEEGRRQLVQAGIEESESDSWLLLSWVFGLRRIDFMLNANDEADETKARQYKIVIARRCEGVPVQYITGEQEFMGFSFQVNENVLIPRLDTEVLVETVLEQIPEHCSVLDMCTGSGCILLSILALKECQSGTGVDLSEGALGVAACNEERIRSQSPTCLMPKVQWVHSDLFENVTGRYDVIVSNPPYIPTEDICGLMREVRSHEPFMALDGHEDGLAFYREIIKKAPDYLNDGGRIFFEIGWNQADDVRRLLEENGFCRIHVKKDLAGLDRVVYALFSRFEMGGK